MATHAPGNGDSIYLDTEQRVRRAEEMICDGYSSRQIVETLVGEFKGRDGEPIVERTAYAAIKVAYDRIAADAQDGRAMRKVQFRATLWAHYHRCLKVGELQAANRVLEQLARIDGLNVAEKIEVTTTTVSVEMRIDAVIGILDDEGLKALDLVLAQVDAAKAKGLLTEGAGELDEAPLPPMLSRGRAPQTAKPRRKKPPEGAS